MNTERWYRIEVLFEQAQAFSEAEREGFLDEVCAGDPGLRRELAALLGSRIGRFRLIQWLGAGGMGDVYLAERDDAQFTQRSRSRRRSPRTSWTRPGERSCKPCRPRSSWSGPATKRRRCWSTRSDRANRLRLQRPGNAEPAAPIQRNPCAKPTMESRAMV